MGVLTSVGETIDAFFPPLIDRWRDLGHDVATAASSPSAIPGHRVIGSLTRNPSLRNVRAPRGIAAWAMEQELDVIITNTATASFLARVVPMPVPVVYFCHGLHWNEPDGISNRSWQGLEFLALRQTDAVIVINDDDEAWFRGKLPRDRVTRLPAGVGVPIRDFPRTGIPEIGDTVEMVWAGEFSERKRPWLAVEVVDHLRRKGVPVHLTMCGDGPHLGATHELVEKLGVGHAVSLVGPSSRVADFLSGSHALLMTSAWEGLPRIGLEAVAVGRPVFAFDVKGTRSLPGVISAPEGDVDGLAEIIRAHVSSDFSGVTFVDPLELHPDYAADRILGAVEGLVTPVGS